VKEILRFHAIVFGDVHGVGFRAFVLQRCMLLGLRGWVRNCTDGSVEVVAEGEKSQLHILHGDLNIGPRASSVERVDFHYEEASGSFHGFSIR
jgi:acylphosphatase